MSILPFKPLSVEEKYEHQKAASSRYKVRHNVKVAAYAKSYYHKNKAKIQARRKELRLQKKKNKLVKAKEKLTEELSLLLLQTKIE
jgi:hypothetical protein